MQRITEIAGVVLSLDPKPIEVRECLLSTFITTLHWELSFLCRHQNK